VTDPTPDRRAELIAAALASDLSPDEAAELDVLRAADPTVDAEIAELGGVVARLAPVGTWQHATTDDALRDRVDSALAHEEAGVASSAEHPSRDGTVPHSPTAPIAPAGTAAPAPSTAPTAPVVPLRPRRSRRAALAVLGAAACIGVGVGGGVLATTARDAPVAGPPGTLGAVEQVAFAGEPSGVAVDGDLVAHTWGTETVLTVDGLPVGDAFSVVVVDDEGVEHESGTFLGTDVTIDCRLNAAVLREHVVAVEVRGADGVDIATATVPAVPA